MNFCFGLAAGLLVVGLAMSSRGAEPLKAGDTAPDFELQGSDGETYKLADLTAEKTVVIAWFPKAFTGG